MPSNRFPTLAARAALLALLPVAMLLAPRPAHAQTPVKAAPGPAAPVPGDASDQARVRQVLSFPYGTASYQAGIDRLRVDLGSLLFDYLALNVVDPDMTPTIRANALLAMRDFGLVRFGTFKAGYEASDPAIRAAAVAALKIALDDPKTYADAVALLTRALSDPDSRVQAKALESLGDREAPVLRKFLAGSPPAELRPVAEQLLRAAEEHGASLVPLDSSGALAHTSLAGVKLEFRPTRRWPQWNAAAGELAATAPKGKRAVVASGVEVVANVLPVAVSRDGRWLAYEAGRQIHVRDLNGKAGRVIGAGIAPRAAPLADGFLYLVPRPTEHREQYGDPLDYDIHFVGWDGAGDRTLGVLGTHSKSDVNGNASPARWMRLVESKGGFELIGEGIETFRLPDLVKGAPTKP